MKIRTEFNFVLPKGKKMPDGKIQKIRGSMRLIKVKDLVEIYHDMRVKASSPYFYVVILTRVVQRLGDAKMINTKVIENLAPENFAFLVDFFNEINHKVITHVPAECTNCGNQYIGEIVLAGEV